MTDSTQSILALVAWQKERIAELEATLRLTSAVIDNLGVRHDALAVANEKFEACLEFYADPFSARDEYGERYAIPDFYSETDFGARAQAVLKAGKQ